LPECARIQGVPNFKFIKNGSEFAEFSGANAGTFNDFILVGCDFPSLTFFG
jgi:hypothetical protein